MQANIHAVFRAAHKRPEVTLMGLFKQTWVGPEKSRASQVGWEGGLVARP
jgi:hypothetical protein